MRFAHLGDLHIGKRVNDFLMLNDQEYVLGQVIDIIHDEKVDAVLIAGDVYDKQVPSLEAINLFDDFLTKLSDLNVKVYIISGNHDSAERLSFAGRLIEKSGVYIAPMFDGKVVKHTVSDEYGIINIYMLPFVKPINVKRYYQNQNNCNSVGEEKANAAINNEIDNKNIESKETEIKNIETYNDALKVVINSIDIDESQRNIIIAHQFVTGAKVCESEELSIGGLENVDASLFDKFDYVALGHIHGPQKVGRDTLRYSGTPLKYSFSEINHKKSVTIVDVKEKNNTEEIKKDNEDKKESRIKESNIDIDIKQIELKPLHEMRRLKGTYEEITFKENYINTDTRDYMHIILTDEEDIPDAIGKLRSIYPNIMKLEYDNLRTRNNNKIDVASRVEEKTPMDLFKELYVLQNNQEMSKEQEKYMLDMLESWR